MPGARDQRESSPDDTGADEDYPSWAIPDVVGPPPRRHRASYQPTQPGEITPTEARPARPPSSPPARPQASRARVARARRTKRRIAVLGALAAAAAVVAAVVLAVLPGGSRPAPAGTDGLVTTYLPGELRSVPDTCAAVSPATLATYLPGRLARAALPGLSGSSGNQCDWTLDHRPMYRLLEVTAQAYAPSALASGNGSATAAAQDAYRQAAAGFAHPPRATRQPPARVTPVGGLGTAAFSAFQVITVGGDTTDRVTVVARFRNVLVTVAFSGLDHADQGGYGPVSPALLAAGAAAAARDVLQRI